ncbi:MAG: hypothetical protein ACFCVC_11255 [Acidimicrobiia bacterium]
MTTPITRTDPRLPVARSLIAVQTIILSITAIEAVALGLLGFGSFLPAVATAVIAGAVGWSARDGAGLGLVRKLQWTLLTFGLVDAAVVAWMAHRPPLLTVGIVRIALPLLVLALTTGRRP